jgi:hypothetical protein
MLLRTKMRQEDICPCHVASPVCVGSNLSCVSCVLHSHSWQWFAEHHVKYWQSWRKFHLFWLLFDRCPVQNSTGTATTLTQIFRGFTQSVKAFPTGEIYFYLVLAYKLALRLMQLERVPSPHVKRPAFKLTTPHSAESENQWSSNPTLPYVFTVCKRTNLPLPPDQFQDIVSIVELPQILQALSVSLFP